MKEKVEVVLAQVRPNLQSDVGDVELVDEKSGDAFFPPLLW